MEDLPAFLRRAAERCGFTRDYYIDSNLPTNPDNIVVAHFFGDLRNEFVLSSLLLKRFRDELRGSKYMILCGWKGHRGLFPYADEYWSPVGNSFDQLRGGALGFDNSSEQYLTQRRELNYFFRHLISPEDAGKFYDSGITSEFRDRLKVIRRYLPMVPSATYLDQSFNQGVINRPGYKVLIIPTRYGRGFRNGALRNLRSCREFWVAFLERLVKEGYCPVVVQSHMTHDLSRDFPDRAVFVFEEDISKVIGMMRATGMVLDVFNGTSRLAVAARTPFLAVDERGRYATEREYEIDDICAFDLPKRYIFSFPTIIESGDPVAWNSSLFDQVVAKLNEFIPQVDQNRLPPTAESVAEVPFSVVRERKAKRIGTKFVRIPVD